MLKRESIADSMAAGRTERENESNERDEGNAVGRGLKNRGGERPLIGHPSYIGGGSKSSNRFQGQSVERSMAAS